MYLLVLDCPSLSYLESIHQSAINSHSYHAIVHLAPSSILNHETYRLWMKRFIGWSKIFFHENKFICFLFSSINTIHHLLLDETQKNVHMEAIYRYQTQLNYVDDGLFPLLSYHHILQGVNDSVLYYLRINF